MSGRRQPKSIEVALPAVPTSIGSLRRRAADFASECGADQRVVADVTLAVSEAATNVVKYAYEDEGVVELAAAVVDGGLEIDVGDRGRGWRAGKASGGLGLGVSIIARVSETLRIVRQGSGTKVQMRFPLPGN